MTNLEYLNSPRFRVHLRQALRCWFRTYIRVYAVGFALVMLICSLLLILNGCGSSGDIGAGNVTNLYINSSVNEEKSVQLVSDDYQIQSIETQDNGNIVIVTLIRCELL